ncbi:MAG: hypothetical protein FWH23_01575 [Bacteroidales bacterium]|nr:hypothetical protein [Bacteroidales bacterium]
MQTTTRPKERTVISFLRQINKVDMQKKLNIKELDTENHTLVNRFDVNGVYILSSEEEEGIKESLEQVAKGELISNEDLILEVASWFRE